VDDVVFHFSEDPQIARFVPHVPRTNPNQPAAVWAIDAQHAPLYWFPRDCPRVTAWPRNEFEVIEFQRVFSTTAHRVHAMESSWLAKMQSVNLVRYSFDAADFAPWPAASGQWICDHPVEPLEVTPIGDLLEAHSDAGIDLRPVPSLWPLHDLAISDRWDFSIVRMSNASPR
jgi:hypothetical protein